MINLRFKYKKIKTGDNKMSISKDDIHEVIEELFEDNSNSVQDVLDIYYAVIDECNTQAQNVLYLLCK